MSLETDRDQARLRLVKSEDFDLCSSWSLNAASPLGSPVRPCSMSLTAEGDRPTTWPIAARVIPMPRRSETRDDHVIAAAVICPSLRHAVDFSQRLPVTVIRNNYGMPRPPDMPDNLNTVGKRVSWWRKRRKISRTTLAKKVGYKSTSGLSDLELGESKGSERLHLIAAELGLRAHYLEYGTGEPEADSPQEAPPHPEEWLFPTISPSRLRKLNKIERGYLETEMLKVLADIDTARRSKTG